MQIEQFDTGLKGQENVEKIVITPEENYNYKQVVRKYLGKIVKEGISRLDQNHCFYPLNEFIGIDDFKEKFWKPLFSSFPDLERREQLVISGAFRDKIQVGTISTLSGVFKETWLGMKPNNKMINLKCCEIHELKDNKIIDSYILIDLIDLLIQTGTNPLNNSRGSEGKFGTITYYAEKLKYKT